MEHQIRRIIFDACYNASFHGGTIDSASEVAATRIMQLVSPYTTALEEHAPHVAEGLDKQRQHTLAELTIRG